MTREEILEEVFRWYLETEEKQQYSFKNCKKENLVTYHNSLGRNIRNEFKLWDVDWEPEIVNGVDISPNHPDQVSFDIIVEVWKKVNEME